MQDYTNTVARLEATLISSEKTLKTFAIESSERLRYKVNYGKLSKWFGGHLESPAITFTVNSWLENRSKEEYSKLASELGIEVRTGGSEVVLIPNKRFKGMMVDSNIHITLKESSFTLTFLDISPPYRRRATVERSAGVNIHAALIWYITYYDRNIDIARTLSISSIYRDDERKRREQGNILAPISSRYLKNPRLMEPKRNSSYDELIRRSYEYNNVYFVDTENIEDPRDLLCIRHMRSALFVIFLNTWNKTCKAVSDLLNGINLPNVMYYDCPQKGKQSMDTEIIFTVASADIDMMKDVEFITVSGDSDLNMDNLSDNRNITRLSCKALVESLTAT